MHGQNHIKLYTCLLFCMGVKLGLSRKGSKKGWGRFKTEKVTGEWVKLSNEELQDLYSPNNIRVTKSRKWGGRGMCYIRGRTEIHTKVWWGNLKDKESLEDVVVEGMIILKKFCKKQDGRAWTGLIWFRRGTIGALLQARLWNFGFHKMRGIIQVFCEDGLYNMEFTDVEGSECGLDWANIPEFAFTDGGKKTTKSPSQGSQFPGWTSNLASPNTFEIVISFLIKQAEYEI